MSWLASLAPWPDLPLGPAKQARGSGPDFGVMAVAFSSASAASSAETPASARGTPQRLRRLRAAAAAEL